MTLPSEIDPDHFTNLPNFDQIESHFAKALNKSSWTLQMAGNILRRCRPDRPSFLDFDHVTASISEICRHIYNDPELPYQLSKIQPNEFDQPVHTKAYSEWALRRYRPLDILRWGHRRQDIELHPYLLQQATLASKKYLGTYRTEALDALNMVLNEFYNQHEEENFSAPKKAVVVAYLNEHFPAFTSNFCNSIDSIARPENAKKGGPKSRK